MIANYLVKLISIFTYNNHTVHPILFSSVSSRIAVTNLAYFYLSQDFAILELWFVSNQSFRSDTTDPLRAFQISKQHRNLSGKAYKILCTIQNAYPNSCHAWFDPEANGRIPEMWDIWEVSIADSVRENNIIITFVIVAILIITIIIIIINYIYTIFCFYFNLLLLL